MANLSIPDKSIETAKISPAEFKSNKLSEIFDVPHLSSYKPVSSGQVFG